MLLGLRITRTAGLSRWDRLCGGDFPDRGLLPQCVFLGLWQLARALGLFPDARKQCVATSEGAAHGRVDGG